MTILIRCQGGHGQRLVMHGDGITRAYVESFAGLLSGTHPLCQPSVSASPIGKCGICGSQFTATIADEADPDCAWNRKACGQRNANYLCTRLDGHEGEHRAHGERGQILDRWPA